MKERQAKRQAFATPRGLRDVVRSFIPLGVVACLVAAYLEPASSHLVPAPWRSEATADFRLVVLRYPVVYEADDGVHMHKGRVENHLLALREHGFVPVRLQDVDAALRSGSGLPRKAVLLTFDGGYLQTYAAMHSVLSAHKWTAAMFIASARQQHRDTTYVYWDRLQRMVDSGIWELGTHGHRDGATAPCGGDVRTAADATEATRECVRDLVHSRRFIESHLKGARVIAAAPPARHIQEQLGGGELRELASAGFSVLFRRDVVGVNRSCTDPWRINRLAVQPSWTDSDIVERAIAAVSRPGEDLEPTPWVAGGGHVQRNGDTIILQDARRADIWLPAAESLASWEMRVDLRLTSGQFWITQQTPDGMRHWRFGGNTRGLHLQERGSHAPTRRLAPTGDLAPGADWHRLRLVRRGSGLWVDWDGKTLPNAPFAIPPEFQGRVAISSAGESDRAGSMTLSHLLFRALPYRALAVSADPTAAEIERAVAQAPLLAAVSPQWQWSIPGRADGPKPNEMLLRMLRGRYAWDILPEVPMLDARGDAWVDTLLQAVKERGWQGVAVHCHQAEDVERGKRGTLAKLREAFNDRGLRVICRDSPAVLPGA